MSDHDPMHAQSTPLTTAQRLGELHPAEMPGPLESTSFDAVVDDTGATATDTVKAPDGTSGTDVPDARQPTPVVRTTDADATVSFKTHHSNLSILADILPILAPAPAPTETVKVITRERSVACKVGPDAMCVEFGTPSSPRQLRFPIVPGSMSGQVVSFHLPPWVLRVAARQPPKGDARSRNTKCKTLRRPTRFSIRVRAPGYVDDEPITWTINLKEKEGTLSVGGMTMKFEAVPSIAWQQPTTQEPASETIVAPDRFRVALMACRPAASRDRNLPERCLVDIKDGVARAGDGRWFAHHRDNALSELDVAVDRADIVTLQALLDRLDRTATTLRTEGDLLLFTDNRLTVGFQPPKKRALTWDSVESWPPTLAFECSTEALQKLLTFSGTLISSKDEEKRDLQIRFFLELQDGDIVLRARATWHRFNLDESSIAITMSIEQADAVRKRLGHGSRGTLDAKTNIDAESGTLEATTLPPPEIIEEAERTAEPATATPATIELGRYAYAELAKAIMLMRSGLTRLGFKEHPTAGATVIIVTDAAVDHTSTYAIPAWAENTTPGLKKRRQQRSYW